MEMETSTPILRWTAVLMETQTSTSRQTSSSMARAPTEQSPKLDRTMRDLVTPRKILPRARTNRRTVAPAPQ
jgi:hypothetical protein